VEAGGVSDFFLIIPRSFAHVRWGIQTIHLNNSTRTELFISCSYIRVNLVPFVLLNLPRQVNRPSTRHLCSPVSFYNAYLQPFGFGSRPCSIRVSFSIASSASSFRLRRMTRHLVINTVMIVSPMETRISPPPSW
jgi:hypothetical protein